MTVVSIEGKMRSFTFRYDTSNYVVDECRIRRWDALIVASALQSGCRYLLTEDLQGGQVIDTMTIISPFTQEPEQILPGL